MCVGNNWGKMVSISFMLKRLSFQAYKLDNAYLYDKKTRKFVGNPKCVCVSACAGLRERKEGERMNEVTGES